MTDRSAILGLWLNIWGFYKGYALTVSYRCCKKNWAAEITLKVLC